MKVFKTTNQNISKLQDKSIKRNKFLATNIYKAELYKDL